MSRSHQPNAVSTSGLIKNIREYKHYGDKWKEEFYKVEHEPGPGKEYHSAIGYASHTSHIGMAAGSQSEADTPTFV